MDEKEQNSGMSNVVADLCHDIITVIARFLEGKTEIPDHVSVSCSIADTAVSFDVYLTKEKHATTHAATQG